MCRAERIDGFALIPTIRADFSHFALFTTCFWLGKLGEYSNKSGSMIGNMAVDLASQ